MAANEAYEGKVVVVTGASSGFGKGTAIELARRGAVVVLAARSSEALEQVALECRQWGSQALPVPTDVSQFGEVEVLASQALAQCGRIDAWINNAGVGAIGRFDEVPFADHEQVVRTDLLGTLAGSYCALPHFRRQGRGVLINVASIIGKIPAPLYASYVAAKFGIVGFSDALRQELRGESHEGIRICTVMPMAHQTEFFSHAANYTGHKAEPIPPTYDPQITIDTLVRLVVDPEDEVITGWQGGVFNFLHKLMPGAVEQLMARKTEKAQLENSPPAKATAGAVHQASHS